MNDVEFFIDMVAEMRQCQRDYFKTKDANKLMDSKALEAKVDKWLAIHEEEKQGPSLFGGIGCQMPEDQYQTITSIQKDVMEHSNLSKEAAWEFGLLCWQHHYEKGGRT